MRQRHGTRVATASLTSVAYLSCLLFIAAVAGGGCVSNEYRISRDELQRLAQEPPPARGVGVHAVQDLGSRREGELESPTQEELDQAWQPIYVERQSDVRVGLDAGDVDLLPGPQHPTRREGVSLQPRGLRRPGRHAPVAVTERGHSSGGGLGNISGGGGGSHSGGGGGGGGGSGGEALVVVAILAVAIAGIVAVGLVASEGVRFQGQVAMAPEQLLYVEHGDGTAAPIPLGQLQPSDLIGATGAVVKDDEGYGLALGRRDPLDRKGGAFNLELGASSFNLGNLHSVGPAAEIQVGGFFHQRWGVMLDVGVSGGDVVVGGAASAAASVADTTQIVTRHHVALELQSFPASWGPLHLGLFARGGAALVGTPDGIQSGPLAGGGAMLQLALTSRLALVLRGGIDTAHLDGGWSTAGVVTAGMSVY